VAGSLPVMDRVPPAAPERQQAPSAGRGRLSDGFLSQRLAVNENFNAAPAVVKRDGAPQSMPARGWGRHWK